MYRHAKLQGPGRTLATAKLRRFKKVGRRACDERSYGSID